MIPPSSPLALCIDLDGTLLRSDLLIESALALLKRNPLYAFFFPLWLLKGKAHLKREIARRVSIDPSTLPWEPRVVALLREAAGKRPLVLCTASDMLLARDVMLYHRCFDDIMASDGITNLSGSRKARALVDRFGEKGFDYAGNSTVDLVVWRHANNALVVNAPAALARAASRVTQVALHLPREAGGLKVWLRALRLHQWLKNLLVFVPLAAAHRFLEPDALLTICLAFLSFGLCASSVYVVNDLLDLESDRHHARKRFRPFASGALSPLAGLLAAPLLLIASFAITLWLPHLFAAVLFGYFVVTSSYSLRLKQLVLVDALVLAALYTIRIIAGGAALALQPSFWLLAFSMFLFLSLALLKRYAELHAMLVEGRGRAAGRGYVVEDLPLLQSLGAASGYIAVLVLALYINSPESTHLYGKPEVLWLLCPVMLYWISRAWVIAHRGNMHDDPVVFAVTDRTSQAVAAICAAIAVLAL